MQMRHTPKIMQEETRTVSTVRFEKLASLKIGEGLHVDVSLRSDGFVSIAQRQDVVGSVRPMYLKNAIQVPPETLFKIRDMLEQAIAALFELQEGIV